MKKPKIKLVKDLEKGELFLYNANPDPDHEPTKHRFSHIDRKGVVWLEMWSDANQVYYPYSKSEDFALHKVEVIDAEES